MRWQRCCRGRLCLPIGKRASHSHPPSPIATLRILSSSCLSLSVCCALLTKAGLSRYERDLLLGLMPCALFIRYRLYFALQNSNPGSPTKRSSSEGRFFLCFSACVARDVRAEHFAMLGGCHDASINTHPVSHGASPTLATPARPLSSIVVPPDSHWRLVEPI